MSTFSVIVNYDHDGEPNELVYDIPVAELETIMKILNRFEKDIS